MADNWVSPTGHNDPDSAWTNEANAYDGNTLTYAQPGLPDHFLELTIGAVQCDKVRFYFPGNSYITVIDVYYSGDWHNIYNDTFPGGIGWKEIEIGSTESVTAARIKSALSYLPIFEFEFNDITLYPSVSDSIAIGDTVSPSVVMSLSLSESFAIQDSCGGGMRVICALTDSVSVGESDWIDRVGDYFRVALRGEQPYVATSAPDDAYKVSIEPTEPYKVEIAEAE